MLSTRFNPRLFIRGLAVVLLALPLLLIGTTFARPAAAEEPVVLIQEYAFSPAAITVPVGTTITWTNADVAPHTATNIEGIPIFDSELIVTDGAYRFTFTAPGTYPYFCNYHAFMRGVVIVTEG